MLLKPTSFKRGDKLEKVEHNLVAGIGAFSEACVDNKKRLGGHYIMDEQTLLPIETAELTVYPITSLIRSVQKEDFPTWKL